MTDSRNPCWVTETGTTETRATSPAEIEHRWVTGKPFRVYRHALDVTVADTDRLIRAGFTCVRVVWQRDDLSVAATDVDLERHRRRE